MLALPLRLRLHHPLLLLGEAATRILLQLQAKVQKVVLQLLVLTVHLLDVQKVVLPLPVGRDDNLRLRLIRR